VSGELELRSGLYGLVAEYETPDDLVRAIGRVREAGLRKIEAYTPYPIEEVSHALHLPKSRLPMLVFGGGLTGCIGGFLLQYWVSVIEYPLNVGGRPLNSWPAFVVPTFEMTILFSALTAVFGMFALCGLPRPYHPLFNAPRFLLASRDKYFLAVEAEDPGFERDGTWRLLEASGATSVSEVEW
jgi:hypothetical protein